MLQMLEMAVRVMSIRRRIFRVKIGGGRAHQVGAARDNGVSGEEEEGKVATDAIYTFYHPFAGLCGAFESIREALCLDGGAKEE